MTKEFKDRYIKARRSLIEAEFKHLNPVQREAVMATEGPLLLLAGAGSGKTTVLINRIANLLKYGRGSDCAEVPETASEDDLAVLEAGDSPRAHALAALEPVEPWRIIAITFTNKAADELKARLERMLGPDARDIWAQTFHSACVRILRRDCERVGFKSGFTIYDTSDSLSLMKRILKEQDLDEKTYPPRSMLGQISNAKDALLSAEQYLAQARATGDIRRIKTGEVYAEYSRRLREANAMDFDDLIYFTVKLLQENEEVRTFYQKKFRYVLIDEYQDTNNLQYLLASTLAGGHENICVVGDDDQSIYKFRGATIENILSFEGQYKKARVIKLEQNYRSTGHILDAANAVIRNNLGRKGKELWTEAEAGDKLCLNIAQNENEEARYVANKIVDAFSAGENWRDNAVLYRMNAQSNQLENAFKRSGIPYRIVGGTRFFDRMEIKDMLAYLCVIMTPEDDLRLLRIINTPTRGIGQTTLDTASRLAQEMGLPLFEVVKHADEYAELQRSSIRLRQFAIMIDELREKAEELPADELYDEVVEKTGYIRALQEKSSDENIARIENVQELKSNIISYMKDTGEASLAGFLDEVALYTDMDNYDKDADCVVMMTMHSAKGLEFPNVFIVGAEEGIFPGMRAIGEPEEMEEERRLCYVAITRAKRRLYICCARQRMLFGRTTMNKLSRFVEEIPDEHIDKPIIPQPKTYNYSFGTDDSGVSRDGSAKKHPLSPAAAAPKAAPAFKEGDMITHKAFGRGMIVSMTSMGGDHLLEIAFDGVGTKRLMLRAAGPNMSKE